MKLTESGGAASAADKQSNSHSSGLVEPGTAPVLASSIPYPNNNNNNSNPDNNIVICEEESDDGSLLRAFTVWRSNISLFGDATRLRRTANTPNATSTSDSRSSIDVAEREAPRPSVEIPPPHSSSYPLNTTIPETPGVLVSKSNVPAHLVNKDTVILVRPYSPADAWMLSQSSDAAPAGATEDMLAAPNTTTMTINSSDAPPKFWSKSSNNRRNRSPRVASSSRAQQHRRPDALPAIGEDGESKCSTVLMLQNQSNKNGGDNRYLTAQNDFDVNKSNNDDDASSSRLEMGSFHQQSFFRRSPAVSKNGDDDDDNDDNSSSFFTRTGAPDSKFRLYTVDVDPTDGDRAADLYIFSWARPHMRGFHLAWMSFFIALYVEDLDDSVVAIHVSVCSQSGCRCISSVSLGSP